MVVFYLLFGIFCKKLKPPLALLLRGACHFLLTFSPCKALRCSAVLNIVFPSSYVKKYIDAAIRA